MSMLGTYITLVVFSCFFAHTISASGTSSDGRRFTCNTTTCSYACTAPNQCSGRTFLCAPDFPNCVWSIECNTTGACSNMFVSNPRMNCAQPRSCTNIHTNAVRGSISISCLTNSSCVNHTHICSHSATCSYDCPTKASCLSWQQLCYSDCRLNCRTQSACQDVQYSCYGDPTKCTCQNCGSIQKPNNYHPSSLAPTSSSNSTSVGVVGGFIVLAVLWLIITPVIVCYLKGMWCCSVQENDRSHLNASIDAHALDNQPLGPQKGKHQLIIPIPEQPAAPEHLSTEPPQGYLTPSYTKEIRIGNDGMVMAIRGNQSMTRTTLSVSVPQLVDIPSREQSQPGARSFSTETPPVEYPMSDSESVLGIPKKFYKQKKPQGFDADSPRRFHQILGDGVVASDMQIEEVLDEMATEGLENEGQKDM